MAPLCLSLKEDYVLEFNNFPLGWLKDGNPVSPWDSVREPEWLGTECGEQPRQLKKELKQEDLDSQAPTPLTTYRALERSVYLSLSFLLCEDHTFCHQEDQVQKLNKMRTNSSNNSLRVIFNGVKALFWLVLQCTLQIPIVITTLLLAFTDNGVQ